jgi:DnaJ-class molecular chaperone
MMAVATEDITETRHAYQVLGLPIFASPLAIKQAYRRMARRWHPDLFKSGTPEHAEATLMMKIINEAFAKVEDAPLRGHVEREAYREETRPKKPWTVIVDSEGFPMGDRGDFWIRFFFGACFGVLIALGSVVTRLHHRPVLMVLAVVVVIPLCGYSAGRYGDQFWHSVGRGSTWWR